MSFVLHPSTSYQQFPPSWKIMWRSFLRASTSVRSAKFLPVSSSGTCQDCDLELIWVILRTIIPLSLRGGKQTTWPNPKRVYSFFSPVIFPSFCLFGCLFGCLCSLALLKALSIHLWLTPGSPAVCLQWKVCAGWKNNLALCPLKLPGYLCRDPACGLQLHF